jgi:dephospho-CoA kinase
MSGTKEKYIIGLTGNIGTGKSVVRRMLGHLGAYGIDADVLGHRAISPGAPGYKPVIDLFGHWIVNNQGKIDRKRLAKIVFENPDALNSLESIIHPLVNRAVELLIRRTPHQVVVVEAIKLLEGGLVDRCDTVWVSYTPEEVQVERLSERRNMTRVEALSRIRAQGSQTDKMSRADVVIMNDGSFEKVWKQVYKAWNQIPVNLRVKESKETAPSKKTTASTAITAGLYDVVRATPQQATEIARLLTRLNKEGKKFSRTDVMESFGEKAYLLMIEQNTQQISGLLSWQVENLITRIFEVALRPDVFSDTAVYSLLKKVEEESKLLQVEACMVFAGEEMVSGATLKKLGYEKRTADSLDNTSWAEAAREYSTTREEFFIKPLRAQRVMRPL